MGLCIDAKENKQGLDFEIRRDSVTFILGEGEVACTHSDFHKCEYLEIDKKVFEKIIKLCEDKEWKNKIFGE